MAAQRRHEVCLGLIELARRYGESQGLFSSQESVHLNRLCERPDFIATLRRHRMVMMAHHLVERGELSLPMRHRRALHEEVTRWMGQHTYLKHARLAISSLFARNAVRFRPIKGAALGAMLYRHPADRVHADFDVLVHLDDVKRAWNLLVGMGYSVPSLAKPRRWHTEIYHRSLKIDRLLRHSYLGRQELRRQTDEVDVHWDPHYRVRTGGTSYRISLALQRCWERSADDPTLHGVIVAIHLLDFYKPTVSQIYDLAALMAKYELSPADLAYNDLLVASVPVRLEICKWLREIQATMLRPGDLPWELRTLADQDGRASAHHHGSSLQHHLFYAWDVLQRVSFADKCRYLLGYIMSPRERRIG